MYRSKIKKRRSVEKIVWKLVHFFKSFEFYAFILTKQKQAILLNL